MTATYLFPPILSRLLLIGASSPRLDRFLILGPIPPLRQIPTLGPRGISRKQRSNPIVLDSLLGSLRSRGDINLTLLRVRRLGRPWNGSLWDSPGVTGNEQWLICNNVLIQTPSKYGQLNILCKLTVETYGTYGIVVYNLSGIFPKHSSELFLVGPSGTTFQQRGLLTLPTRGTIPQERTLPLSQEKTQELRKGPTLNNRNMFLPRISVKPGTNIQPQYNTSSQTVYNENTYRHSTLLTKNARWRIDLTTLNHNIFIRVEILTFLIQTYQLLWVFDSGHEVRTMEDGMGAADIQGPENSLVPRYSSALIIQLW